MPTSAKRKPRKRASANQHGKYEPTQWGRPKHQDLVCPSGQICLVQPLSIVGLVEKGILTNVDELTALVNDRVISPARKGVPIKDLKEEDVDIDALMEDPESIDRIMAVVDRALVVAVLQPQLHLPPKKTDENGHLILDDNGKEQDDDEAREEGRVYTDTIDIQDKMFIFQFVLGGTKAWTTFRDSTTKLMGDLHNGKAVAALAKSDIEGD